MARCYIMGPMTGMDQSNWPAFDAARDQLDSEGWYPVSPADISRALGIKAEDIPTPEQLQQCMRDDFIAILTCDAIFALPGWLKSIGSAKEYQLAEAIGVPVFEYVGRRQILAAEFTPVRMMFQMQQITKVSDQFNYVP